jgi:hypothetical protein
VIALIVLVVSLVLIWRLAQGATFSGGYALGLGVGGSLLLLATLFLCGPLALLGYALFFFGARHHGIEGSFIMSTLALVVGGTFAVAATVLV